MDESLKQMLVASVSGLASAVGGYYLLAQSQIKANQEAKRQLEAEKSRFEQQQAAAREQFEREMALAKQRIDSDRSAAGQQQAADTQKVLDAARVQFTEKFEKWLEECEGQYEAKVAEANSLRNELIAVSAQRDSAEQKVEELKVTIATMEREIQNLRQRVGELESRQGITSEFTVNDIVPEIVPDTKPKRRVRKTEVTQ